VVHLHRECFDLKVAPYFGVYFKWLRVRHAAGVRILVKTVLAKDHRADLKILGDHLHVRLWGVGMSYFEFATSGVPVINYTVSSGGLSFPDAYETAIVGVNVSDSGRITAEIRTGKRHQLDSFEASLVRRQTQINLFDEPVEYRSSSTKKQSTYPGTLYESYAPTHPYTGVFMRAYNWGGGVGLNDTRGSWMAHTSRDVGYDVGYADGEGVKPIRTALIQNGSDWPRAMGRITVTDPNKQLQDREFGVYLDAFNVVAVFPLALVLPFDYTSLDQNVDENAVRRMAIPLPSWVYKPTRKVSEAVAATGDIGLLDYPEIDWKFHPDGKRACAVVIERQTADYDAAYFGTNVGTDPFTETDFTTHRDESTGYASRHNGYFQKANLPQRYFIGTGVIEFTVNITLTSNNLYDYTLDLTVREVRRPTTSKYCTMLAGYVWYDIKDNGWTSANRKLAAARGDMVVLDIERYYRKDAGGIFNFFSVKNLTKDKEVRTWRGDQILDFDLPSLSFVMNITVVTQRDQVLQILPGSGTGSITLPYQTYHPSAMVVTFNKARQMLFPVSIPQDVKDAVLAHYADDLRKVMADTGVEWTLIEYNDLRDWSDPELAGLRDYRSELFNYKSGAHPPPSPALNNWFGSGLNAYLPATPLLYVSTPRFSWYVYADEIVNRILLNPSSTFFVHPSGSWAFYDNQFIYNKHGMYGPTDNVDTLTPFQQDANALEHVIYDHVHIERGGVGVETTFLDMYNIAVAAGNKKDPPIENFITVTRAQTRANFDKTSTFTYTSGDKWLDLKVLWYPHGFLYYPETGYKGGVNGGYGFGDTGGLRNLSLGGAFFSAPGYGGQMQDGYGLNTPITFSSCLMVQT
jgi:hypothetical protein